jgi:hypothetical protein
MAKATVTRRPTRGRPFRLLDEAIGHIRDRFGVGEGDKVGAATEKALAGGVPILSILAVLLPLVLDVISGEKIDVAAIVKAILALLGNRQS